MSPAQLRELRAELVRWNHRQDRAREEYRRQPISSLVARPGWQCKDEDCRRRHKARGWCDMHYRRELKAEKEDAFDTPTPTTLGTFEGSIG